MTLAEAEVHVPALRRAAQSIAEIVALALNRACKYA